MGEGPLLQKLFNDYLLQRLDSKQRAGSKWKPKGGAGNGPAGDVPVSLLILCSATAAIQHAGYLYTVIAEQMMEMGPSACCCQARLCRERIELLHRVPG